MNLTTASLIAALALALVSLFCNCAAPPRSRQVYKVPAPPVVMIALPAREVPYRVLEVWETLNGNIARFEPGSAPGGRFIGYVQSF